MDQTLDHVSTAALKLPIADRAELAARLLASLNGVSEPALTGAEWEDAWATECDRREAELDADPAIAIPASEVFRRVQDALTARAAQRDQAA